MLNRFRGWMISALLVLLSVWWISRPGCTGSPCQLAPASLYQTYLTARATDAWVYSFMTALGTYVACFGHSDHPSPQPSSRS